MVVDASSGPPDAAPHTLFTSPQYRAPLNASPDGRTTLKMRPHPRSALALLAIALLVAALALALGAAEARASDGGMAGMPGMTDEQMQNMTPPTAAATPAPAATAASAGGLDVAAPSSMQSGDGQAMDPQHGHGCKGSINSFMISGFIFLVTGSTMGHRDEAPPCSPAWRPESSRQHRSPGCCTAQTPTMPQRSKPVPAADIEEFELTRSLPTTPVRRLPPSAPEPNLLHIGSIGAVFRRPPLLQHLRAPPGSSCSAPSCSRRSSDPPW